MKLWRSTRWMVFFTVLLVPPQLTLIALVKITHACDLHWSIRLLNLVFAGYWGATHVRRMRRLMPHRCSQCHGQRPGTHSLSKEYTAPGYSNVLCGWCLLEAIEHRSNVLREMFRR